MIVQKASWKKDQLLRGASAIVVDFSKFCILSGLQYEEAIGEPICFYKFKMALFSGQLIDLSYPARPILDYIEQLSTRQLFHSRLVSLLYFNKYLTVIVTGQEILADTQLP